MSKDHEHEQPDIIDDDLYEEMDEDELIELVEEEKQKALEREKKEEKEDRKGPPAFPKWAFYLIAFMMALNVLAFLPKTFSIPAIDFLMKSAELSTKQEIDTYQESVVVIESGNSKGTGFSISSDGYIVTNHHVVDNEQPITVAFPEQGLFKGEIVADFEEVDLALLKVENEENVSLPHLPLAKKTQFEKREHVYFIGNPLRFNGIANEGEVIGYTRLSDWDQDVLMLDAPIYHGNSGSPVINEEGEVIAVVFATIRKEQYGKVGLAVPITYYHEKIKDLPETSTYPH